VRVPWRTRKAILTWSWIFIDGFNFLNAPFRDSTPRHGAATEIPDYQSAVRMPVDYGSVTTGFLLLQCVEHQVKQPGQKDSDVKVHA
jgi:hypothetical protein